ncbi:pentapeptide repeat-containing protein [Streptomyces sp. NPDC023998]|uniref:pentapeptide repeat-containing protein n=1 Tax=Streptomyces sp. NPDC023998 TaxID=3154597 RepID=UPI0033F00055
MTPSLPRRRTERRGLRLWPVGTALTLTFATAIAVAAAAFFAGWDLLGAQGLKPERQLTSSTLFDLVKLSFGVVAGAGALVALVVAYRRQRVDEDGALRDATRLHTERFTTAVSQLGEESAAVRLGGVHALAGLANDAPTRDLRQTCIDVLCAYLRLPYTAEADLPLGDTVARHEYLALREVRHTVIRLIRDHLRLTPDNPHSWQGHDLDFTGVVFDGGDFSGAVFSGGTVNFSGAVFSSGTVTFTSAWFSGGTVTFNNAGFSGGTVRFDGAFSGGTVTFDGAGFSGGMVTFDRTGFSGGTVRFDGAEFSGGTVRFDLARFSGGTVTFDRTEFSSGTVAFNNAGFSGGTVTFDRTGFTGGTVRFDYAGFSGGTVRFDLARFSGGMVTFNNARFSDGTVRFDGAEFSSGTVCFDYARFSGGMVTFDYAGFTGGTVDFSMADGVAPSGLVPSGGQPLPTGLSLPQAWYQPTP